MLTLVREDGLARQRSRARGIFCGLLGGLPSRAARGETQHCHEVVVLGLVGGTLERLQLFLAGGLAPERLRDVDDGVAAALLHGSGGGRVVGCDNAAVQDVDGLLVVAGDRQAEEGEERHRGSKPHQPHGSRLWLAGFDGAVSV